MKNVSMPVLALVVPCYNEEEIIVNTVLHLNSVLRKLAEDEIIHPKSFLLLVDDGSTDGTISQIHPFLHDHAALLKLSRNFGHQSALLAGLQYATDRVDICISLDADLQDDTGVIPEMIKNYHNGSQIVYGVRINRQSDTWFKRFSAELFYRLLRSMRIQVISNHADFRLVSNRVLHALGSYREVNLFLRGLFPLIGFSSSVVKYTRRKREAGESKYPFWKMIRLALTGITSFTNFPLKIITAVGTLVFFASLAAGFWVLWVVVTDRNIPGWASITLPVYFMGGIQLMSLGVLGEYIAKVYLETKNRPHYHVEEVIDNRGSSHRSSVQPIPDSRKDLFLHKES